VNEATSTGPLEPGSEAAGDPTDTPLLAVLGELEQEGWTSQFAPLEGGDVRCLTCRAEVPAADLPTGGMRRLEGASDPADMVIVVPVTCPRCDTRGVLVAHFGPDGGPEDIDVVSALGDLPSSA
jgi:hypothetical protein